MSKSAAHRRVLIVTGSRSEFGLLRPVMEAVKRQKGLTLQVAVAGEHLLGPAFTWREVAKAFRIDAKVPMQKPGDNGRAAHAAACGRGVEGFAKAIKKLKPDWIVVLGDRIEAFAAASAASIAGVAVCHIHGGDRAEGIADEAMRHAITKLAHLHCAATKRSAERIVKMGEPKNLVHVTGSPAIDGLDRVHPLSDKEMEALGEPLVAVLLHPSGLPADQERALAVFALLTAREFQPPVFGPWPVVVLEPNHDPGRDVIVRAFERWPAGVVRFVGHLPRSTFLSLLKRLASYPEGTLLGNSSAGLIEAAALGLRVVNIGPRQAGRERSRNVIDVPDWEAVPPARLLQRLKRVKSPVIAPHPYGDGSASPRIAALLAKTDPHDPTILRKRIAY